VAADDEPLSEDLENVREILFPNYSEAEGRARLRAALRRAGDRRKLTDALIQRVRREKQRQRAIDPSVTWAREVFEHMEDHTSDELAEVAMWLEGDPARADVVFASRLEAFQAWLRAGERL
jgi:hypothetical protein